MKKYAVINIGSLKTKCLIAGFDEQGRILPCFWSNNLTCFGCSMQEGFVLNQNLESTIKEILRLKEIIKEHDCDSFKVFATQALREAKNKEEVKEQILKKTGCEVRIIDPQTEGRLFFEAVLSDFNDEKDYAVTDIGGGSCQVLIGNKKGIKENYSFKTGGQVLHEKFICDPHNPQSFTKKEDILNMKEFLDKEYSLFNNYPSLPLVYGTSNIIDVLKAIKVPLEENKESLNHPYKTEKKHLEDFVQYIAPFSHQKREEMFPFQEGYMWGIDKAFLNAVVLAEKFSSPFIIPTNLSVLHGFLYEMKKSHTACCGLNCSKCAAFLAETEQEREKVALEWTSLFKRKGYNRPSLAPEDVVCSGCLSSGAIYLYCRHCPIRECCFKKGFKNCKECPEYRCEQLKEKQKHFFKNADQS